MPYLGRSQAERWGAELYTEDVEEVDLSVRPFTVRSSDREVRANSVIVATGASAKRLGLPSEPTFWSRGISACAICDGASPLFKNGDVAVVGGGDSAAEEAVYLTKYAKHVSAGQYGIRWAWGRRKGNEAHGGRCLRLTSALRIIYHPPVKPHASRF